MAKFNPETRESVIVLNDGTDRIIFKTHNGFKCWLQQADGKVISVSQGYFNQIKHGNTHQARKKGRRNFKTIL